MTFGVDADRLSRSRFVLSRLVELSNGLEVLVHPDRAPYARGWVDRTRRRLDPSGVAVLLALVDHGSWYVPDFLVPVPDRYEPTLDDELAAVAAVPADLVRFQLEMAFQIGPPPPAAVERSRARPGRDPRWPLPVEVADVLATGGEAALTACVAEQLGRCWLATLAESWPAVRRALDEDVRHRAARASRVGFSEIVGDLHRKLRWDGAEVTLELPYDVRVDAVHGLVLTPSVFLPRPAVWLGSPGQVMVGYPARGRGLLWSGPAPAADEARVLGDDVPRCWPIWTRPGRRRSSRPGTGSARRRSRTTSAGCARRAWWRGVRPGAASRTSGPPEPPTSSPRSTRPAHSANGRRGPPAGEAASVHSPP